MYLRIYLFFILFFLFQKTGLCQKIELSENCNKAYQNIIALKLDSGRYFIAKEYKENSGNKYCLLLENYIDFLSIYCSGQHELIQDKKHEFDERIKSLKNLEENLNSPYTKYIEAEIQLHTAILLIKNNEYFSALFYIKKSLRLLEENREKYPHFKANEKSLGLLYSVLGSLPNQFKTGLSIVGLNRDINQGMALLKKCSEDKHFIYQHESSMLYAFMLFHLSNKKEKAWQILKENNFLNNNSKMDLYAIAHIGIFGLHNDEAIKQILETPFGKNYENFPLLNYMLALGKTYRQDSDANKYFQAFLDQYLGLDYIKSSYQKMAWNELIKGNQIEYQSYIEKVQQNGRTQIDTDKQAEKESITQDMPNAILLKARLLSDGNYNTNALNELNKYDADDFVRPKYEAEYEYRKGRIFEKLQQFDKAIEAYKNTIDKNESVEAYFGANACYLIASIFEKRGDKKNALSYYEKCLRMNGYEYHNSIMQKAKAGKNRIN